jgi:hypothetical protein
MTMLLQLRLSVLDPLRYPRLLWVETIGKVKASVEGYPGALTYEAG